MGDAVARFSRSSLALETADFALSDQDVRAGDRDKQMKQEFDDTTQSMRLNPAIAPRVLLVDDDELILEHLETLVVAAGFEVCTAQGGAEAIAALERSFSPIVITDLNMPGMDGLSLCRTLRQRSWPGYIYVVVLTMQNSERDILAGLDAGADDYLSKRMSSAQLLARLRTAQRLLTLEQSLEMAVTETRRLALTDALTGAPNRRYFEKRLSREMRRVRRFGGDICLLSLDIDRFKSINDRHGHAAGDLVLREFAYRLSGCLPRDTDWYARTGGEEFSVVLEGTDQAGAEAVGERVRQAISATPIETAAGLIGVTVSIGIGCLTARPDSDDCSIESLLDRADRNLYTSKENGRNCVTSSRSLMAENVHELTRQGSR